MINNFNPVARENQDRRQRLLKEILRHPDVVKQPGESGADAVAYCPGHPDREGGNPNLRISIKKSLVKCFRCGFNGVENLAKEWGILLPERSPAGRSVEPEAVYNYRDSEGKLIFQVVRLQPGPGGKKGFRQRRPDPANPGQWIWDTRGLARMPYRLPELSKSDPNELVCIVEGEKDADRLAAEGVVATTNPGGAGKWRKNYSNFFLGRRVAVIPDNDEAGLSHANQVATSLMGKAAQVRMLYLPDLKEKGDVSDWLDQGNKLVNLVELFDSSPEYEPVIQDEVNSSELNASSRQIGKYGEFCKKMIAEFKSHGFFVNGGGEGLFFFDRDEHTLMPLDENDLGLLVLLSDKYGLNKRDPLFAYLFQQMLVEAQARGKPAILRQFSYYDHNQNLVYLDMGSGNVLKISVDGIEVRGNGEDGVLFSTMVDHSAWTYSSSDDTGRIEELIIGPVNFSQTDSILDTQQQQTLLLLWLLSMAFESMMPTKVLAVALGPAGSGKTTMFRSCGHMLIGPNFEVDSLLQQQRGEEDFWINAFHSFLVCYDNVDRNISYLPDALAQVATGVRRSKRHLHTNARLHRIKVSCMLALTARTPTGSLRRDDVADRALLFNLGRLKSKRPEFDIQEEIENSRSELMSEYARMVQKTLAVPLKSVEVADPEVRIADFFRVATRIAMGLGPEVKGITDRAVWRIRQSQHKFAIEENNLVTLLWAWLEGNNCNSGSPDGSSLGSNYGRTIQTKNLFAELRTISSETGTTLSAQNPTALGRQLNNLLEPLNQDLEVEQRRVIAGSTWTFRKKNLGTGGIIAPVDAPVNGVPDVTTLH
ncbi:MAG: hypothetical protein OXE17_06235 [Chloroflexi bacterium]|nr:hypothetical protein [Chloroflexota bacterium]